MPGSDGAGGRELGTLTSTLEMDDTGSAGSMPTSPGAASRSPTLSPGEVIGRYRVTELVGAGGMGEVYAAEDMDLDRPVALKVLRAETRHSDAAQRLLREAKAMARLSHPNVMTVYEVDSRKGLDFIVMEFVRGHDLREWAKQSPSPTEVAKVFRGAGLGVAAAHAAGLIHRDLKPANILKADDGRILVADFGVVRLHAPQTSPPRRASDERVGLPAADLTMAGTFVGTPPYAAPEQFRGEVTPKSDQYSLCASMYAVLFGRPPHGRVTAEVVEAAKRGQRATLPPGVKVPRWLWKVVARGLEPNPDDRFPTMEALVLALRRRPAWRAQRLAILAALASSGAVWAVNDDDDTVAFDCTPGERLEQWDRRRATLEQAFVTGLTDGGEEQFESFATAMDEYADGWAASWSDACKATRVQGVQSEAVMNARVECLVDRAQRVNTLLDAVATVNDDVVRWARGAVYGLPPVEPCNHVSAEQLLPAPDEAARDSVAAVRSRLIAIEANLPTVSLPQAMDDTGALVAEARRIGFAPLVAEALMVRGRTLTLAEHLVEARRVFEEALLVAEEVGHGQVRARSAVALVQLDAELWDRGERFDLRLRRARLAVEQYPYENLAIELDEGAAVALEQQGDLVAARELLEVVVARRKSSQIEDPVTIARSERHLGIVSSDLGQLDDAIVRFRSSFDRVSTTYAADTRDSVEARDLLAEALRGVGAWDEARVHTTAIESFLDTDGGKGFVGAVFEPWRQRLATDRAATSPVMVVDGLGHAVQGAEVVVARTIVGDGMYATAGSLVWWVHSGANRATTDDTGRVEVSHPTDPVWAVAEHSTGRSWPVKIDAATAQPLVLPLRPWARLQGKIEVPARGVRAAKVHVFPRDLGAGRDIGFYVTVAADGTLVVPRLAAGPYIVGVEVEWDDDSELVHRFDMTIGPDSGTDTSLEVVVPSTLLEIRRTAAPTGAAPEAKIFVVSGTIDVTRRDALDTAVVEAVANGPMALGDTVDGALDLRGLPPGPYTMCVIARAPGLRHPQTRRAMVLRQGELPVQCDPIRVEATPVRINVEVVPTTLGLPP
ncbi:MAG: protein kinase [Deltaproteobacteria bacterium]|nr:protein kinase [Deltaproteobacteria bacterium]